MQHDRISQPPFAFLSLHKLLQLLYQRLEACPHSFHEETFLLLCDGEEGLELGKVGGDGFLAQDVFAC